MLQDLYDSCGAKNKKTSDSKSSSKRQKGPKRQRLEPPCNSTKKYSFAMGLSVCIKVALDTTKFVKMTEGQTYSENIEENEVAHFLALKNEDKAKYFKREDVPSFSKLAEHFLRKMNICLQQQFHDDTFCLEDVMKEEIEDVDLAASVAAQFEQLVENGVADEDDADIAWTCPQGHHAKWKRHCDAEAINAETLEGPKCCAPLCIECNPQMQTFDLCPKCNTPVVVAEMTTIFEGREKHARRQGKLDDRRDLREVVVKEYNDKVPHPFYCALKKAEVFAKNGVPVGTKRPYTKAEAFRAAECYGPAHDLKAKIKKGALPPIPEQTIKYNREKTAMNGAAVKKRLLDKLKLLTDELMKVSPKLDEVDAAKLDKVDAALDDAERLLTKGRTIMLPADVDLCNAELQACSDLAHVTRNPPEPGAVADEEEEVYGSGIEDDEEEEDGNDEHDLQNEKLKEQDELDLMKLLESSDDEEDDEE
jgi:hypothetical protein